MTEEGTVYVADQVDEYLRLLASPDGSVEGGGDNLEVLGTDECWRLVTVGGVGRVVSPDKKIGDASPVDFRADQRCIVFRTASGTDLNAKTSGPTVGFTVEHADESGGPRWKVLIKGQDEVVTDILEVERIRRLSLRRESSAGHDEYHRIRPSDISGWKAIAVVA
jgi:uncharacterized protein